MSIVEVSIFLYGQYFYKKKELKMFISILTNIFLIYMVLNLISYIYYPDGLVLNEKFIYFLGYRTRFTEYSFILILLSILEYNINIKKLTKMLLCILVAILNVVLPKVSTAITGIIIMISVYLLTRKFKKVNYQLLGIIAILVNFSIVLFRIQDMFAFFIEGVLNKSVDLTYRTSIWNASFGYIFDNKLLLGHMYPDNGNFILWANITWQAHNQILQLLYEVGIVGTVLFFHICLKVLGNLKNNDIFLNKKCFAWIGATFFSFLIMMTTEIYSYYLPFYVLIVLCLYSKEIAALCRKNNLE